MPAAIAANKIHLAFWCVSCAASIIDGWWCFGSGGGGCVGRDGFGVDFNIGCLITEQKSDLLVGTNQTSLLLYIGCTTRSNGDRIDLAQWDKLIIVSNSETNLLESREFLKGVWPYGN